MKHILTTIFVTLAILSCRNVESEEEMPAVNEEQLREVAYANYGETITADDSKTTADLEAIYESMKPADTVEVKVKTKISEVCAKKGCWIEIPVSDDQNARVTFKDYSFFLPKNGQGKEVILEGKAFKSQTSIDDLKHFAMDGGKSQEEIDAITEDQITWSFEARGALVESFEGADVFKPAASTPVEHLEETE